MIWLGHVLVSLCEKGRFLLGQCLLRTKVVLVNALAEVCRPVARGAGPPHGSSQAGLAVGSSSAAGTSSTQRTSSSTLPWRCCPLT